MMTPGDYMLGSFVLVLAGAGLASFIIAICYSVYHDCEVTRKQRGEGKKS